MANPGSMWASDLSIGYKCARNLFYGCTERGKRPVMDDETKERLNFYASLESIAIYQMQQIGWNIIKPKEVIPGKLIGRDQQEHCTYNDSNENKVMSGYVDLIASPQGIEIAGLYEVKSAGKYIYDGINIITDFIDSHHYWIPGQLAQWCMYMYMSKKNYGGLIQVNRDSLRVIDGKFSIEAKIHHCSILKDHQFYNPIVDAFAQKVMSNIDLAWTGAMLGEPPEFCHDLALCSHCWCNRVTCFPPISNPGIDVQFIGTSTAEQVARMLELKPLHTEYERLQKVIETPLKTGIQDHGLSPEGYIIGEGQFIAKAKLGTRKSYDVPDSIKKQYEKVGQTISITIESLAIGGEEPE